MTSAYKVWHIVSCAAALCFLLAFTPSAHAEVVRTGYSSIVVASTGKCLDISGGSTSSGGQAIQWHCNFAGNENWTVVSAGQGFNYVFKIVEQQSGLCLDVSQASTAVGAAIVQNTCGSGTDEQWTFAPSGTSYQIVNVKSGLCANVSGNSTADAASIVQSTCSTAANFLWTVSSGLFTTSNKVVLQAAHSGQCLFVNTGPNAAGSPIVQNPCAGVAAEQWTFYPYNSQYVISSASSSGSSLLCMTVSGSGSSATLALQTCTTNTVDIWNLVPVGGSYQFVAASNGLCLTVPATSQTALAATGLSTCGTGTAAPLDQLWSLSAATIPSSWSSVLNLPVDPIAVANLPNGTLLTWSAYDPYNYEGDIEDSSSGQTYTSIFDPIALTSTDTLITSIGADMFCPGTANLFDGRILVNGGSSSPKTSIFNPATGGWVTDKLMNIPRGYEGDTVLQNGSVLTLGGSWNDTFGGKTAEVWTNGSGWTTLTGVPETNIIGNDPDGIFRADNHLWLFAAPNGNVFHAGPSAQMNWITTSGAGTITSAGNRADDPYAVNGKAVLYDVGLIMKTGGAPSYDTSSKAVVAQAGTYIININTSTAAVTKVAPMAYPRAFANGVVLPNGQVVIIGGQTVPAPFSDADSILVPEIWDPVTQVFRQLNAMVTPRNYHSSAILLADGRVFEGGGGQCGQGCAANHFNTEILTPPYLLNANGTAATRPTIASAPATGTLGNAIAVTTGAPVTSFVLMRLSSATHTVNNDQRRIPLQINSTSGNSYSLAIPSNAGIVLQGYYWLFALNAQGVPSVGSTILIN